MTIVRKNSLQKKDCYALKEEGEACYVLYVHEYLLQDQRMRRMSIRMKQVAKLL